MSHPMYHIERFPWSHEMSHPLFELKHICNCLDRNNEVHQRLNNVDHPMLNMLHHICDQDMSTCLLNNDIHCNRVWSFHSQHRFFLHTDMDMNLQERKFSTRKEEWNHHFGRRMTYILTENMSRWASATFIGHRTVFPWIHIFTRFWTWWSIGRIDLIGWAGYFVFTNLWTTVPLTIITCTKTIHVDESSISINLILPISTGFWNNITRLHVCTTFWIIARTLTLWNTLWFISIGDIQICLTGTWTTSNTFSFLTCLIRIRQLMTCLRAFWCTIIVCCSASTLSVLCSLTSILQSGIT